MNNYRVELEDDAFEIITADSDDEAIEQASNLFPFFYNIIKLDENYEEIKTIF